MARLSSVHSLGIDVALGSVPGYPFFLLYSFPIAYTTIAPITDVQSIPFFILLLRFSFCVLLGLDFQYICSISPGCLRSISLSQYPETELLLAPQHAEKTLQRVPIIHYLIKFS